MSSGIARSSVDAELDRLESAEWRGVRFRLVSGLRAAGWDDGTVELKSQEGGLNLGLTSASI